MRYHQKLFSAGFIALLAACNTTSNVATSVVTQVQLPATPESAALEQHFVELQKAASPNVYASKVRDNGITEMFLAGEKYRGKATRIFALYKAADKPIVLASGKSPAVVLVHGGGGSAFEDWVKEWNKRGFAAISVAVEGQIDVKEEYTHPRTGKQGKRWIKHEHGGPSRTGIYGDSEEILTDQWMFHATTAVVRAQNFLREQASIDKHHIGLTGISWGGIITSTVMGLNTHFDFAIPIYGCGFLDGIENQYGRALASNTTYKTIWEPGLRLKRFNRPSLWLNWRKDVHFALDAHQKNYDALTQAYSVSLKPGIKHGHGVGWRQAESYFFAQQMVTKNNSWVTPLETRAQGSTGAYAKYHFNLSNNDYQVTSATIHYTRDKGHTGKAKWIEMPAQVKLEPGSTDVYHAHFDDLPSDVVHWFINLAVNVDKIAQLKANTYLVTSNVVSQ